MPSMAIPRSEKRDETARCGLRGLETGRDGGALYKIMVSTLHVRWTRKWFLSILSTVQICTIQKVTIS
jgi:hypothetical protein